MDLKEVKAMATYRCTWLEYSKLIIDKNNRGKVSNYSKSKHLSKLNEWHRNAGKNPERF